MNLCPFLSRASFRETNLLFEAVVANPDAIERYVSRFIHRTTPQIGRTWFAKKLRTALLNTPELLRPVTEPSSNYPPYANDALERGEPVYVFDPRQETLAQAASTYAHLTDWFNALDEVANRPGENAVEQEDALIAKRELSKIMHYDPQQATERADNWFKHMGTRATGSKQGVEIVLQWPDGYYAVRYTDKETMMRDGSDLQNCLAQGYYWDAVQKGTGIVYGIRKPTDEAVVGIRVIPEQVRQAGNWKGETDPAQLVECKGKNNKPVSLNYQPYVVDFLNHLGAYPNTRDLEPAGIFLHDGKFGSYDDIAETLYDQDGLKVRKAGVHVDVAYQMPHMDEFDGSLHADLRVSGNLSLGGGGIPEEFPIAQLLTALNLLDVAPDERAAQRLDRDGVVYNYDTKKYGMLLDVGAELGRYEHYRSVSLGRRFVLLYGDQPVASTEARARSLTDIKIRKVTIPAAALTMFFNSTKRPPDPDGLNYLARQGVLYVDKTYIADSDELLTKLPAIAATYGHTFKGMPMAGMDMTAMEAMKQIRRKHDDAGWERKASKVIDANFISDKPMRVELLQTRKVAGEEIPEVKITFPYAAMEVSRVLLGKPSVKAKQQLQASCKAALAYMKKHPLYIVVLSHTADLVAETVRQHNLAIKAHLKLVLDQGTSDMSSRFGALNAIKRIDSL